MSKNERTTVTAVYLTAIERDLIMGALECMTSTLRGTSNDTGAAARFAKSYTAKRLEQVRWLFKDKAPTSTTKDAEVSNG